MCFFLFFFSPARSSIVDRFVFYGYFGLKKYQFPGGGGNPSPTGRQGLVEHVRANSGYMSKGGVNIRAFVRKTRVICVRTVALQLLSFSRGSTFDVNYELILALCSQIFESLRDFFCRHALDRPESFMRA